MIGVGSRNCVRVCNDNGTMLATWQDKDRPRVIKWSNDGEYIKCMVKNSSRQHCRGLE